ncbi:VC0807 family protein [Actinacidiphila alni]|uniref:VC0807 family protein n=1 Tax=Actinacidiphila alni TaxID=380248 RepID=UPI003452915E
MTPPELAAAGSVGPTDPGGAPEDGAGGADGSGSAGDPGSAGGPGGGGRLSGTGGAVGADGSGSAGGVSGASGLSSTADAVGADGSASADDPGGAGSADGPSSADDPGGAGGPRARQFVGLLVGDLVAPVVVYGVAHAVGAGTMTAALLAGAGCLPRQAVRLAGRRRLDGLGAAVLAAFVVGALLTLISGDPRVMALKDVVWPLAAGLVTAVSCRWGRPVTFYLFRPLLTQGRPENRPLWDRVWAAGGPFRRCLRTLAALWAAVLLATAGAELALCLSLPADQAAAVPGVVPLVAVPLLLGATALYGARTGLGVRASLALLDEAPGT